MAVFTGNNHKGKTQKEKIKEVAYQIDEGVIAVFGSDAWEAHNAQAIANAIASWILNKDSTSPASTKQKKRVRTDPLLLADEMKELNPRPRQQGGFVSGCMMDGHPENRSQGAKPAN